MLSTNPSMDPSAVHHRHRRWYLAAAIVFALGLWLSVMLFIEIFRDMGALGESYVRVLVPGTRSVYLASPGAYTIFFEYHSELDGRIYSTHSDALDGLDLRIEAADTGKPVAISAARSGSTYSLGSRKGRSILAFAIPAAGWYRIQASLPGEAPDAERYVLAIGQGFAGDLIKSIGLIFLLVAVLFISIGAPTACIVVGAIRGKKAAAPPAQKPGAAFAERRTP